MYCGNCSHCTLVVRLVQYLLHSSSLVAFFYMHVCLLLVRMCIHAHTNAHAHRNTHARTSCQYNCGVDHTSPMYSTQESRQWESGQHTARGVATWAVVYWAQPTYTRNPYKCSLRGYTHTHHTTMHSASHTAVGGSTCAHNTNFYSHSPQNTEVEKRLPATATTHVREHDNVTDDKCECRNNFSLIDMCPKRNWASLFLITTQTGSPKVSPPLLLLAQPAHMSTLTC